MPRAACGSIYPAPVLRQRSSENRSIDSCRTMMLKSVVRNLGMNVPAGSFVSGSCTLRIGEPVFCLPVQPNEKRALLENGNSIVKMNICHFLAIFADVSISLLFRRYSCLVIPDNASSRPLESSIASVVVLDPLLGEVRFMRSRCSSSYFERVGVFATSYPALNYTSSISTEPFQLLFSHSLCSPTLPAP